MLRYIGLSKSSNFVEHDKVREDRDGLLREIAEAKNHSDIWSFLIPPYKQPVDWAALVATIKMIRGAYGAMYDPFKPARWKKGINTPYGRSFDIDMSYDDSDKRISDGKSQYDYDSYNWGWAQSGYWPEQDYAACIASYLVDGISDDRWDDHMGYYDSSPLGDADIRLLRTDEYVSKYPMQEIL